MAWSAPGDGDDVGFLGEESDTCPYLAFPCSGVCWVVGPVGQDCRRACTGRRMQFKHPIDLPSEPLLPRVLGMSGALPEGLKMQIEWAPFECFVSSESRFHLADFRLGMFADWRHDLCELVCPCVPMPGAHFMNTLAS